MKNFSLNPLSIAFIVAISVSPSHAQTYSINTNAANTIVRGAGNRQYIYCQENDSCGYFVRTSLLQNQQCDGIRMIGVVVTDFTYWNDTLYFVGRKKNNTGVYGWVKIRPNGYFYPFTVRSIGELRDRFYNLKRIQVFRSGGDLHALVVGDYTPHGSTERSCLIDIVNNTSCQYAYTTDEVIDDVCLTENYVSVVARKGGGIWHVRFI